MGALASYGRAQLARLLIPSPAKSLERGRNMKRWQWWLGLGAMTLAACGEGAGGAASEEPEVVDIPEFEDYLGGKEDTGYVGTRAAELEATFTGHVRVMLPGKTDSELQALARALQADPGDWSHRDITAHVTEQLKYARNALKAEKLDLNLEGGSPEFDDVLVIEGGLELHYRVRVESLVKFKALEGQGLTPADLVGRTIAPKLPLVPAGLFDRTGNKCAFDPDLGAAPAESELGGHNLFYYFAPEQEGCPLQDADLVTAAYAVESSLDAPTVYPEYDKLVADKRIDMVALFGQIEHGELKSNDWGFIAFDSLSRAFQGHGFAVKERFPERQGHRLEKTYPGGLKVSLTMYTPVLFADNVPREDANKRFQDAIRDHEIVYYNGHAFYGSLTVLDDPSVYPQDRYQIMFMDACWSYAYYTKQIFRNRATEGDPEGYALVDVINNTEPGITGSERTAEILYHNIFKGASAVLTGGNADGYSWNNLVKYMNDHAEVRARQRTQYPDPEIYGVSGVRTNRWKPGIRPDVPTPPAGETKRFESATRVAIPDNAAAGAESVIEVDVDRPASQVKIQVAVEHTYVGDLLVTLEHGGRKLVLHERTGGGADNLNLALSSDAFAGVSTKGAWKLKVVDSAKVDTGAIVKWSVDL